MVYITFHFFNKYIMDWQGLEPLSYKNIDITAFINTFKLIFANVFRYVFRLSKNLHILRTFELIYLYYLL